MLNNDAIQFVEWFSVNIDLVSILSILASITGMCAPFIIDFFSSKDNKGNHFHSSGDMNFNINLDGNNRKAAKKNEKNVANQIIDDICLYVREKRKSLSQKIKVTFFVSLLLVVINILLVKFGGEGVFLSGYVDFILYEGFQNKCLGYLVIIISLYIICFYLIYVAVHFFYERELEKIIWNLLGEDRRKIDQLKSNMMAINKLKGVESYPFDTLSRIVENMKINSKNRTKITKGDKRLFPNRGFFSDQQSVFYRVVIGVFSLNFLFLIFFSDSRGMYLSEIRMGPIAYENGDVLKERDLVKLVSGSLGDFENQHTFSVLGSNGKRYLVGLNSIKTVEPKGNFLRSGMIMENTPIRFTPYQGEGRRNNSYKKELMAGEEVRIHKYDSSWLLVLTTDNRQGFVRQKNIMIY